jgi:hypothetical protein
MLFICINFNEIYTSNPQVTKNKTCSYYSSYNLSTHKIHSNSSLLIPEQKQVDLQLVCLWNSPSFFHMNCPHLNLGFGLDKFNGVKFAP